jgi:hypothetical protein
MWELPELSCDSFASLSVFKVSSFAAPALACQARYQPKSLRTYWALFEARWQYLALLCRYFKPHHRVQTI